MAQVKLERLQNDIKKAITMTLKLQSKDIIFKNITITDVKISKDSSYAVIFWTVYEKNLDLKAMAAALEKAKGFCRTQLAKDSSAYKVPQLRFKYDATNTRVQEIEDILSNIKNSSKSE